MVHKFIFHAFHTITSSLFHLSVWFVLCTIKYIKGWFDVQGPSVIFHWLNTFILVHDDSPRSSIAASVDTLTSVIFLSSDFELVLDRHLHPVPYSEPSQLQISENGNVHWQSGSEDRERTELPPGARRYASCDLHLLYCAREHVKTDIIWFSKSV